MFIANLSQVCSLSCTARYNIWQIWQLLDQNNTVITRGLQHARHKIGYDDRHQHRHTVGHLTGHLKYDDRYTDRVSDCTAESGGTDSCVASGKNVGDLVAVSYAFREPNMHCLAD